MVSPLIVSFLESAGEVEKLSASAVDEEETDGRRREEGRAEPWSALLPMISATALALLLLILAVVMLVVALADTIIAATTVTYH